MLFVWSLLFGSSIDELLSTTISTSSFDTLVLFNSVVGLFSTWISWKSNFDFLTAESSLGTLVSKGSSESSSEPEDSKPSTLGSLLSLFFLVANAIRFLFDPDKLLIFTSPLEVSAVFLVELLDLVWGSWSSWKYFLSPLVCMCAIDVSFSISSGVARTCDKDSNNVAL